MRSWRSKNLTSWNAVEGPKQRNYSLLNASYTTVRFNKRVKVDLVPLLVRMEELGVPLSFTEGLEEIYFTYLRGGHGYYLDGKIRMSCSPESVVCLDRTLVHELGHHVDEIEDLSNRQAIIDEKRLASRFMSDTYARKDVAEYVAVGFEMFYLGTPEQRAKMRKCNPKLYLAIQKIHRIYRRL